MHGASLHFTGANPIVEGMSSSMFILAQKVQVKPRYADALRICWRTKPGQCPFHVGEDFLCLMFRRFCQRRKRFGLTLHGPCADFIENAIHSYRAEQIGIRSFLDARDKVVFRHLLDYIQLLVRLKKGNHRFMRRRNGLYDLPKVRFAVCGGDPQGIGNVVMID